MGNLKYYTVTLVLYLCCVTAPVFIDDLGVLFEVISAFGLAITSFALPALFYLLLLCNPKANHSIETKCRRIANIIGSVSMILFTIANILLVLYKIFNE